MNRQFFRSDYFQHVIPISALQWRSLGLKTSSRLFAERKFPPIIIYRQLALSLNKAYQSMAQTVFASHLNLFAILQTVYRYLIDILAEDIKTGVLEQALRRGGCDPAGVARKRTQPEM